MRTVWLLMCSTVAPMARGGGGDIPGNDLGQRVASSSACTHVLGAYGARTGGVGGAAGQPSDVIDVYLAFANGFELCPQTSRPHSVACGECGREVCTHNSKPFAKRHR